MIWVYLSEVFPNRVRAKGQSLGSFTHWFMNALISWSFPMIAAHSRGAPFVFFAAMMVVQFFVVLFVVPGDEGRDARGHGAEAGGALRGPILQSLKRQQPEEVWPAASSITDLFKREGLIPARHTRRKTPPYSEPLGHALGANQVWCADFKGWFCCGEGTR